MGRKRDKRRTKGPKIDNALQGDGSGDGREDVIARLLQRRSDNVSPDAQQRPSKPMIQDASGPPTRPNFEMPDLAGSASLLARVQSFLPQLQQANTALPLDQAEGSAFELIEENSDDDEDEDDSSEDIKHKESSDSDEDSDDEEGDAEAQPQIVMNLALGVFEEKKPTSGTQDASSSDDSSSDEAETTKPEDEDMLKEAASTQKADGIDTGSTSISLSQNASRSAQQGKKKPLIEEMS